MCAIPTCSGCCNYTPVNTAKLMQPTLNLHCIYTFGTLQVHSNMFWVSTALATFACKRKPLTVYLIFEVRYQVCNAWTKVTPTNVECGQGKGNLSC